MLLFMFVWKSKILVRFFFLLYCFFFVKKKSFKLIPNFRREFFFFSVIFSCWCPGNFYSFLILKEPVIALLLSE